MILSHFIFQTIFGFWSSYYFLNHALNSNIEFFAGLFCLFFSGMMFILRRNWNCWRYCLAGWEKINMIIHRYKNINYQISSGKIVSDFL